MIFGARARPFDRTAHQQHASQHVSGAVLTSRVLPAQDRSLVASPHSRTDPLARHGGARCLQATLRRLNVYCGGCARQMGCNWVLARTRSFAPTANQQRTEAVLTYSSSASRRFITNDEPALTLLHITEGCGVREQSSRGYVCPVVGVFVHTV